MTHKSSLISRKQDSAIIKIITNKTVYNITKTQISNLPSMTRLQNNLHQVRSISKYWKAK